MRCPSDQLLVIFGASGDLTERKLMPSLFELHRRRMLPAHFAILGASRTKYTDENFRQEQGNHISKEKKHGDIDEVELNTFLAKVYYVTFNSVDPAEYVHLSEKIESVSRENQIPDRITYYLATPPVMYELVPAALKENHMNLAATPDGWRRIVVEKPFGSSLETAKKLNRHLTAIFHENEIYRIDHYLGKETVQNILVLRFSNGIFEPLWNRHYIDSVEINVSESIGIEERGKYYDGAGAMRDMIQNHLMQLMGFVAMESPSVFDPEPIRDEIVKVFRAVRPYKEGEVDKYVVRGQYEGYQEEKDVAANSVTETFVAMKFYIDNWRWSGVPFFFSTGKKLPEKNSEIIVHFKSTPHLLFAGQCSGGSCNKLVIRIQPDEGISLKFGLKLPGAGFRVKQVSMDFRYDSITNETLPDAYERLLLDAMLADSTLYARSDALEASWQFIDPILAWWKQQGSKDLYVYQPGQDGPVQKVRLIAMPESCPCE